MAKKIDKSTKCLVCIDALVSPNKYFDIGTRCRTDKLKIQRWFNTFKYPVVLNVVKSESFICQTLHKI